RGAYRPVPTIIEAAQRLFARHGVEEIAAARADIANLRATTAAIRRAIAEARRLGERRVVFVTGIPGAGKTLCGLNLVFGQQAEEGAAFLTGNAPLVAVLRGALERDAVARQGRARRQPRREARTLLQNVHRFLEHHVRHAEEAPAEPVVVFDEAQRAWDAAQARRDTQRRRSILTDSEPAHLLEIMARHPGWSVVVALIGQGQEINTGEAGLAEWGRVIAASGGAWQAVAAPAVLDAAAEP
ncbi:DNA/RNA helicase domain-containing protein, partial [Teichococcus cervicalis]